MPENFNWAMLAAGIASIGVFWNQFKALYEQLSSLVIVNIDTDGEVVGNAMLRYFWDNYKPGVFGRKSYGVHHDFIRPKDSYGYIGYKKASSNIIFWNGWRPLFVTHKYDPNIGYVTNVSFFRGTYQADDLLANSADHYTKLLTGERKNSRFFVRKFYGEAPNLGKDGKGQITEKRKSGGGNGWFQRQGWSAIGYKDEDIGVPTSTSPFSSLCYSGEVGNFCKYLTQWKDSKDWYVERGIPWKLGALLHGVPGTGKTSFVRAVAQDLNMPIAVMDLTSMSNEELTAAWAEAMDMAPVIILFEDLDRIFDGDKNLVSDNMLKSPLTLDALLNCMSGINPADGVIVMVTANDVAKIDSSIGEFNKDGVSSRPGRLDISLEFQALDEGCRRGIAERVLSGHDGDYIETVIEAGSGETGAQFTKRCSDIALKKYWQEKDKEEVERREKAEDSHVYPDGSYYDGDN